MATLASNSESSDSTNLRLPESANATASSSSSSSHEKIVQEKDIDALSDASTTDESTKNSKSNLRDLSPSIIPPELNAHNRDLWRENNPDDFSWSKEAEPHVIRRGQILEKHPELKNLYVNDSFYSPMFCLGTCIVQLITAYIVSYYDLSWGMIVFLGWLISGSMNHSLVLAMHELSHDLWFNKIKLGGEDDDKSFLGKLINSTSLFSKKRGLIINPNPLFAFLINCPTCVASASTFKRYHLEHHSFQGSDKWDADIPTPLEGKLFNNTLGKLFFVALQPFFYGFRPIMTKPKPITIMEVMNWVVVGSFDFFIVTTLGPKAIAYLFLGSILGLGLHPIAGHFIAEHFEFISGQETYSYYGPLNFLTYNVGYHNEHHDMPKVCGRLLPIVREVCRTGGVPKKVEGGKGACDMSGFYSEEVLTRTSSDGTVTKSIKKLDIYNNFSRGIGTLLFGCRDWEVVEKKKERISNEFYEDLPHYDSWTGVLLGFILGRNMNCFCRVKRGPL